MVLMVDTERTQAEIDAVWKKVSEQLETGQTRWRGMTYEQGVDATLRWLLGYDDPMPDK